ncbi:hypothetical protein [Clostridium kluyveri]|uniref:Uncharacterized protein n=1 Tax=Clostridium kluyveri (strain ATCC 8527 / DSM 555 / NBRC 12016 / NCIMB 10680 / K1) TaxID=431943 RepID=A5MYH4_CLOK5|nr:hypothetical protein [Clostridium kluyveri]EDK33920.1 Hypothetical protein CKL_1908 [Clostridium kluyveri DSM 555]
MKIKDLLNSKEFGNCTAGAIVKTLCYPYDDADYYVNSLEGLPLNKYSEELESMERPCRRRRRGV